MFVILCVYECGCFGQECCECVGVGIGLVCVEVGECGVCVFGCLWLCFVEYGGYLCDDVVVFGWIGEYCFGNCVGGIVQG